jgi:hypothetical protein
MAVRHGRCQLASSAAWPALVCPQEMIFLLRPHLNIVNSSTYTWIGLIQDMALSARKIKGCLRHGIKKILSMLGNVNDAKGLNKFKGTKILL